MYKHLKQLLLCVLTSLTITSCVPSRMFDDMKSSKLKCEEENSRMKAEQLAYTTEKEEMRLKIKDLERDVNYLKTDTSTLGTGNRRLTSLYNELSNSYDKLVANNDKLLSANQSETKKMIQQLQLTQEELLRKEDSLKVREKYLSELNEKLKSREAKVVELQTILDSKENEAKILKESVTAALLGFNNNGLTITQKNGKVYVSLEEQLLFASGSTVVDPKGEQALKQLAAVLEKNPEISILIEGHTDNVPIKGGNIKDNWDLSVLRATSVVRILGKSAKIDPVRLTPAGKGEYVPLDTGSTAEARKKNRRIEVVLSPRIDEILNVLEKK
ncbi:MAG TPA: OmpA family protein [Bacteroidia bacterium]|nr:OmpA family protein [Bacteroidia bacterium]